MPKYTYDYVKTEFNKCGYELISGEDDYTNTSSYLEYRCSIHNDKISKIQYRKFLEGVRCKDCFLDRKRISNEVIIEKCNSLNLSFIKSYTNNGATSVVFVCPQHKEKGEQHTRWLNLKDATYGCKYCCGKEKSHNDFIKELSIINPDIIVLGTYASSRGNIKCRCKIDNHEWYSIPNRLLGGAGCPICGIIKSNTNSTKSHDKFINELKDINPDIEVLGKYTGVFNKIKCKCKIDNYEWTPTPDSLLHGKIKCPQCTKLSSFLRQVKSNDQFVEELKIMNPMIQPLEKYYTDHTKILCRCLIHNYEWQVSPNKILHRPTGCPKCTRYENEVKLHDIFDKYNLKYIAQKRYSKCVDKHTLPFDFYLTNFNVLIEYDGEGHYQPIKRGHMTDDDANRQLLIIQKHDLIKNEYCENNNIPLIRIPYWERANMEYFLIDRLKNINISI